MHKCSCLCGTVTLTILSKPKAVTNCFCKMCQKQHGAAFATYCSIPKQDIRYTSGQDNIASYNSSGTVVRKFCSICGSNIQWSGSSEFSDWVSIPVSIFDTEFKPSKIKNSHRQSRACWLDNI